MSIRPSGTEPSDTLKYTPVENLEKKLEIKALKELKEVFNQPICLEWVHGEYMVMRDPKEGRSCSGTNELLSLINNSEIFPPEMIEDIKAGMPIKDVIDKYKGISGKNMGL